jgi:predicted Zn finger-like uncharacterized protein
MALATRCPHCDTTFRVASDQLKLRGGIVRCGACQEIFDGNASLVDMDAPPTAAPAAPLAKQDAAPHSDTAPEDQGEIPIYTLDLAATFDPLGILPQPETDAEARQPPEDTPQEDLFTPAVAGAHPASGLAGDEQAPAGQDDDLHLADEAEAVHDEHVHDHDAVDTDDAEGEADVIEVDASEAPAGPEHLEAHASETEVPHEPDIYTDSDESSSHHQLEASLEAPGEEGLAGPALPPHAAAAGTEAHAQVEHMARIVSAEPPPLPQRESSDGGHFTTPAPAAAARSARARASARRSKLTPTKIAPPKLRVPEIDEPDFVKRGRQREQTGKRWLILMAVGSVVLVLLLVAQGATAFRSELAARFPGTKPALAAMCSVLRCRVELPARIDNLAIETGELQSLGPDTYVLVTLLHNQAGLAQAWPDIELALTDANDKPLVRRVFAPVDYLPKGVAPAAGFGAHAEQPVKLYFQLDQLKPSGYHIAVFYP